MRALSRGALGWLALCAASGAWAAPAAEQLLDEPAAVARVLDIVDQRLALMPAVAAYKWRKHLEVSDPPREELVIAHGVELAQPLGLQAAGVRDLLALQIHLANEVENGLFEKWHDGGFDFAAPVPDLTAEVRPRLDRLTAELLQALYVAAPLIDRDGFATRHAALAAERLHGAAWTPAHRAELLAGLAAVGADCAPTLHRIDAAHVLRIGTTADYAPFSSTDPAGLRGADIELARALARRLGVAPVFVRTTWVELLADLRRCRFDLAVGGISATQERAAAARLSIPYASGGKTILARCRDAARFTDLAAVDQSGVRVIVNPGGTNEQFVRANVHRAAITVHADNPTIFEELLAGRADAMITDDTEAELEAARHPQLCRTLPGTLSHADKVILMARDADLAPRVDAWLKEQLAAGVPASLLRAALTQ